MDKSDELVTLRNRLTEQEQQLSMLRAAIRASPAGILIATAPDGVITEWNPAAIGIRGASAEEVTEIPLELHPTRWQTFRPNGEPFPPEDLPLSRAILRGEVVDGAEVVIRDEDGAERWVDGHAAPVFDDDGNLVAGVVVFPDVTERKAAELRAARFQSMADLSPDFIGLWLLEGAAEYINPAGLAMVGLTEDDAGNMSLAEFFSEESAEELTTVGIPMALERGNWRSEVVLRGSDESDIPISLVLIVHRPDEAGRQYVSAVLRDLRPMRELESKLRQMQRLESVGRLAGGIAHDFNNLLTIIDNYTVFVRDSLDAEDPRREDLAQVGLASTRAADLCVQLLSFARRQIIHPTVLQIAGVVEDLMKLFRRTLGEDVLIAIDIPGDLWAIKVDRSQLDQILLNLVVNARDAMPNGGTLTVEAANVTLDDHYASMRQDVTAGDYLMIAVSDTGTGMSSQVRESAFEPFFTTKGSAGNGLGLATVFGAVRQNGGHIWLYSEEGKGSCFKIFWPRVPAVGIEVSSAVPPLQMDRQGTVLVVEDEPALLRLTTRLLGQAGFNVLSAEHGLEAVEVANGHDGSIDLLLTDVVMPHMNGKELASKLTVQRPEMRVLYVSGYTENTIVHGGVLDNNVAFLAKPFSQKSLLEAIAKLYTTESGEV